MKIRVLSDHVANLIAAGEVVERPSSVVRELVDNALDAGAKKISITLEQGGQTLIRIIDDGCGMDRDDALLAFERHATSKLSGAEDLNSIATLGFRGEALPSIASVAKIVLRTKSESAAHGTELEMNGGKLLGVKPCACTTGTDIEVKALFFNTPARRKFLKSPRSEVAKVKQWLLQMALGHPAVHFRLSSDGEECLNLPPKSDSLTRAKSYLRGTTVSFTKSVGPHRVSGLLGHPSLAEGEIASFAVVVNGRLVSDRMILRAVKESFGASLKEKEFPVGYLLLELPPEELDVNVHPQKSEVRFKYSQAVFNLVYGAIVDAIKDFKSPLSASSHYMPSGNMLSRVEAGQRARSAWAIPAGAPSELQVGNGSSYAAPARSLNLALASTENTAPQLPTPDTFRFASLRFIGQLFECYLLCELDGDFYAVDMHAAHERWNYNRIRTRLKERSEVGALTSQKLLLPEAISLGEEGVMRMEEHAALLESLGFELSFREKGVLEIHAVPSLLAGAGYATALREIAAVSAEQGGGAHALEYQIDQIAARLACHASVRSGKILSHEEVYSLFELLDSAECSSACPHGRPVIVSFSEREVESWFGRDR